MPDLLEALKVKDIDDPKTASLLHQQVMMALGKIGPDARAGIPAIIETLQNKNLDYSVRIQAILALEKMGSAAKEALPALHETAKDESDVWGIRQAAKRINTQLEGKP